jgi:tRNA A37 N6-isopentenylltransferase MiaA
MLASGLLEEYQKIHEKFGDCRPLKAIGYRQIGMYLENRKPSGRNPSPGLKGLHEEIHLATRQLVKQQRTWFRSQSASVKNAKGYLLDEKRAQFEKDFKAVY